MSTTWKVAVPRVIDLLMLEIRRPISQYSKERKRRGGNSDGSEINSDHVVVREAPALYEKSATWNMFIPVNISSPLRQL